MQKAKEISRKLTLIISSILVFFIFIFGVFAFSNLIHETSHQIDLEKVSNGNDSLCVLTHPKDWNKSVAYYETEVEPNKESVVQYIRTYTETKASAMDFVVTAVFFVAVLIVLFEYKSK
jgi:hypothetical protein